MIMKFKFQIDLYRFQNAKLESFKNISMSLFICFYIVMIGQRGINDQSNEHGSSIRSTIITFMLLLLNIASIRLNLNEIYTLRKRGNQLTDFDYIVGPAHLRKLEEKAYRKLNHDLEEARVRHRFLDKELKAIENHPLADIIPTEYQEIKRLKHEKLKCKDYIVQLMRKQKNELQQQGKASQSPSIIELGSGGFGKVTLGECVNTKKDVAIKISSKNDYKALSQEYEILKSLPEFGFPKVFHFGQQVVLDGCEHAVMVSILIIICIVI